MDDEFGDKVAEILTKAGAKVITCRSVIKILGNTNVGQISFETEGDEMYVVHQLHLRVGGSQYKKSFTCRTSLSLPKLNEKPPL